MEQWQFRRSNQKGFTLIEMLLSLVVTCLIVVNCSAIINIVKVNNYLSIHDTQLENGIKLLSQEIVTAHTFQYGSTLQFINSDNDKCQIILDKKRIVMTPGHHIFCHNIDDINFYKKNHFIYIKVIKNKKEFSFVIGSDYDENIESEG